jgi:hypothetical protein
MLSNIFLHHVLDGWFVEDVKPRMKGRCFLIRFADDFIIGFELEEDARRVMEVLPKRFNRFGLAIHPKKTALIKFRKPNFKESKANGNVSRSIKLGTFDDGSAQSLTSRPTRFDLIIPRSLMRGITARCGI